MSGTKLLNEDDPFQFMRIFGTKNPGDNMENHYSVDKRFSLHKPKQITALHTPWAIKKRATFIFTITLANVNRFQ